MTPLPDAVLFDMDGTLLDWGDPDEHWREVLETVAPQADGLSPERLFEAIAAQRKWFYSSPERARLGRLDIDAARREIVSGAFQALDIESSSFADRVADLYSDRRLKAIELSPGALDVLDELRRRGIALALVTNGGSESQRHSVDRFGLAGFFDHVQIEGELGLGKPDRRVFENVLAGLGVSATDAWMVGDNLEADIAGAQAARIFAVWYDPASAGVPDSVEARPDRVIGSLHELLPR